MIHKNKEFYFKGRNKIKQNKYSMSPTDLNLYILDKIDEDLRYLSSRNY